jgi:hypothetical protein
MSSFVAKKRDRRPPGQGQGSGVGDFSDSEPEDESVIPDDSDPQESGDQGLAEVVSEPSVKQRIGVDQGSWDGGRLSLDRQHARCRHEALPPDHR